MNNKITLTSTPNLREVGICTTSIEKEILKNIRRKFRCFKLFEKKKRDSYFKSVIRRDGIDERKNNAINIYIRHILITHKDNIYIGDLSDNYIKVNDNILKKIFLKCNLKLYTTENGILCVVFDRSNILFMLNDKIYSIVNFDTFLKEHDRDITSSIYITSISNDLIEYKWQNYSQEMGYEDKNDSIPIYMEFDFYNENGNCIKLHYRSIVSEEKSYEIYKNDKFIVNENLCIYDDIISRFAFFKNAYIITKNNSTNISDQVCINSIIKKIYILQYNGKIIYIDSYNRVRYSKSKFNMIIKKCNSYVLSNGIIIIVINGNKLYFTIDCEYFSKLNEDFSGIEKLDYVNDVLCIAKKSEVTDEKIYTALYFNFNFSNVINNSLSVTYEQNI